MKVLDLFSGIGGFSLGLERAGMKTIAFCEIDPFCKKVLRKHWPLVPIIEDVKSVNQKRLDIHLEKDIWQNIDLICGGFPCQDISVAGKRKGIKGERSGLWKEFHRVIKEIKPKYVIIENVANLRNEGLNQVLKDLWQIGYDSEWYIIPASAVGAPHRRERMWIIAYPNINALRLQPRWGTGPSGQKEIFFVENSRDVADSDSARFQTQGAEFKTTRVERSLSQDRNGSDSECPRLQRYIQQKISIRSKQGETFTEFGDRIVYAFGEFSDWFTRALRVGNGLSKKLDRSRLKSLGNSIVPEIAQIIGESIMEYEKCALKH